MTNPVRDMLAPIYRRVLLTIGRAVIHAVADEGKRQMVQIRGLAGEDRDMVERIQHYGFTSVPLPGAQAVIVCVGGNRDHTLVIADDDPRYRLSGLQPGESAIFNHTGSKIVIKADGSIEATPANGVFKIIASDSVQMDTPILQVTGQVHDMCAVQPHTMNGMREIYNTHTHHETNTPGGDTQEPNEKMSA